MTEAERQQEDFPKCSKCGSAIWVEHSADCPAVVETKPTNGDIKALQARAEAADARLQALQQENALLRQALVPADALDGQPEGYLCVGDDAVACAKWFTETKAWGGDREKLTVTLFAHRHNMMRAIENALKQEWPEALRRVHETGNAGWTMVVREAIDMIRESASLTQPGAASREVVMDCEKELNAANATLGSVAQKVRDWRDAELRIRVLHGGLPGSGYDKLADGYGTCADELADVLALTQPGAASPLPDGYWRLRVEHARKQGGADGFQEGWHAALTRIRQGDAIDELTALVPGAAAPERT